MTQSQRWSTRRVGYLLGVVLVSPLAAAAQQQRPAAPPPAKPVRGATVEGITEYTLPNGLRVLLFPDPSKPTTTVNLTVFVGSRFESYGETGMAHLLEHLLFKGSPRHRNIPQELTEHGARPNGTTWFDRTNYFETFPATPEHLAWALDLEADRLVNSFVAKQDLESEMTVVRNEYEAGENDPFNVLLERAVATAYLWHNYGKSTIGARSDIENVPIERLQAFYHKYYQPDNAMLVVAGRFDEQAALTLIAQKFGRIPRPRRNGEMRIWPTYTEEPVQDGERSVTLRRVGDVQVVAAVYHVPAGSHEDFAAVAVLAQVLGDEPAGRLYKALVEPKLAASVGNVEFQLREPGALILYAVVRKQDPLDTARAALRRAIDGIVSEPASAAEVERARATLLKNIDLALNNSDQVGLRLSEWAAMGDWRLLFLHRDRIKRVTPADVQRVAVTYLKPSNRTLGTFIPIDKPDRAEIPPVPDVAALVRDYKGETARSVGEAFDPSPANIERRLTRATLASGLQLALLPKKTRGGSVAAQLTLRLGSEQALMNRGAVPGLAADMLLRGTTHHTRQQMSDELDRLKARVLLSGGPTQAVGSIETTRENLAAVLRLLGEALREPAFDPKEFDLLKQERLAGLEQQLSEPQARGFNTYLRHIAPWPKGHPNYTGTLEEQIADLQGATLDDVRRFYADFYGAGTGTGGRGGQLAIVGDFDAREITTLATELFGSWKSALPFVRIPQPYVDVDPIAQAIETPDKANAVFVAGQNLKIQDTDPDYPALLLWNYMMGGGFLNSRLATRIRQKEGLSYGVGSQLSANALDQSGRFTAFAIYAPQNVERLEQAFHEEIGRALQDGFTPEEVAKAKDGYLQSRQVSRAQDRELATTLATRTYQNRTLDYDAELERKVAALTPERIAAAGRRHIDPRKFSVVKAGDFANHKAATGGR